MVAEWIGPTSAALVGIAGIFFTWWSGVQGRAHAERLVQMNQSEQERTRLLQEKRHAYIAALKYGELEAHRRRYERKERWGKLEKLELTFPKGERVRMSIDARAGLDAFGSDSVRELVERWREAGSKSDSEALDQVYRELRDQIRLELGRSQGPTLRSAVRTFAADRRTPAHSRPETGKP